MRTPSGLVRTLGVLGIAFPWLSLHTDSFGQQTGVKTADRMRAMNCVVVSPEGPRDGGDFGPFTPDTKTSGLQEAFDRVDGLSYVIEYRADGDKPLVHVWRVDT